MKHTSYMADAEDIRKAFAENRYFIDDSYMVYVEEHEGDLRVIAVGMKMSELMENLPNGGKFFASIINIDGMDEVHDKYFAAQVNEVIERIKYNES